MSSSGFGISDFASTFATIGPEVAGFIAAGAGVGAIVLAGRWGLGVALSSMKKAGK